MVWYFTRRKKTKLMKWMKGPVFLMYLNYFFATWGSRMWAFALGLFFVVLTDKSLFLSAVYGFLHCGSVMAFGSVLGKWIDDSNRLYAIQRSLLTQKLCVALCAFLICIMVHYNDVINHIWNGALAFVLQASVVALAVVAELATITYQEIQLIKDWFIVTTAGSKKQLAGLNAGTRAVDQITNTLTPIITGQIMTSSSKVMAGLAIAGWHLVAIFLEGCLLTKIYYMLPDMAVKTKDIRIHPQNQSSSTDSEEELLNFNNNKSRSSELEDDSDSNYSEIIPSDKSSTSSMHDLNINLDSSQCKVLIENVTHENYFNRRTRGIEHISVTERVSEYLYVHAKEITTAWKIYRKQSVFFAGLSLAFLFMTVLGFDSVTVGYIYSNHVPENIVGRIMGLGSMAGVLGAYLFTQGRKYIGLEKTGMISMTWQLACLSLCVISLLLPGSPFQPSALWETTKSLKAHTVAVHNSHNNIRPINCSAIAHKLRNIPDEKDKLYHIQIIARDMKLEEKDIVNYCSELLAAKQSSSSLISYSIVVFLIGVCMSRLGLYMTDLVITQIVQENVTETERGTVNGMQWSLNKLIAMGKFSLVLLLPNIQTFGYLVVLTFVFISLAFFLYIVHCWKFGKLNLVLRNKLLY